MNGTKNSAIIPIEQLMKMRSRLFQGQQAKLALTVGRVKLEMASDLKVAETG